jgi:hypothetical protein
MVRPPAATPLAVGSGTRRAEAPRKGLANHRFNVGMSVGLENPDESLGIIRLAAARCRRVTPLAG